MAQLFDLVCFFFRDQHTNKRSSHTLRSISTVERYHYFCIGYSTKNITLLCLYDVKMQLMIGSLANTTSSLLLGIFFTKLRPAIAAIQLAPDPKARICFLKNCSHRCGPAIHSILQIIGETIMDLEEFGSCLVFGTVGIVCHTVPCQGVHR